MVFFYKFNLCYQPLPLLFNIIRQPFISFQGSDILKNDGIYSAYVTNFTLDGRYSVKISVKSAEDSVVAVDTIVGVGAADPVQGSKQNPARTEATNTFQRVSSAGTFTLSGYDPGI